MFIKTVSCFIVLNLSFVFFRGIAERFPLYFNRATLCKCSEVICNTLAKFLEDAKGY
jgi:hypothetical protein